MIPASFSLDPACLAGSLPARLAQVRDAGFSQIMLWGSDLVEHPGGYDEAVRLVRASGLRVTGLQVLRDYEGRSGANHQYKLDIAKATLDMCRAVASPLLVVCSTTQADADEQGGIADLRKLTNLAVPLGVRIGYKALPWARHVRSVADAWQTCLRVNHANFSLVLDSVHMLMNPVELDTLEDIDPGQIALLQLADFSEEAMHDDADRQRTANHGRVFPGDGGHSQRLADIVRRIDRCGYRGDYSFLVMNDDYRQLPPSVSTAHARRAVTWITDQVLRRSLPLLTTHAGTAG